MGLYEDLLALGYSEGEARELAYLAENSLQGYPEIGLSDEEIQRIVDKFDEIPPMSFWVENK